MSFTGMMGQMGNMMTNPQGFVMQQAMQNMIRENPQQWGQVQNMFNGKSQQEQMSALQELYKSKGLDLNATAKQWGIQI